MSAGLTIHYHAVHQFLLSFLRLACSKDRIATDMTYVYVGPWLHIYLSLWSLPCRDAHTMPNNCQQLSTVTVLLFWLKIYSEYPRQFTTGEREYTYTYTPSDTTLHTTHTHTHTHHTHTHTHTHTLTLHTDTTHRHTPSDIALDDRLNLKVNADDHWMLVTPWCWIVLGFFLSNLVLCPHTIRTVRDGPGRHSHFRSCVRVEVDVLGCPS